MSEQMPNVVDISIVIPTYRRVSDLIHTLSQINQCHPRPREILVHVDFGDTETAPALREQFPSVRVLIADSRTGPGGGRNRLISEARHEVVVSLDDDSWPVDSDFFAKAEQFLIENKDVGIVACHIIEADAPPADRPAVDGEAIEVGGFVGCGAIIRREAFLQTAGYLPLAQAYGMEESDVALQMASAGWRILYWDKLTVFHNCDRSTRHAAASINAAQIRNIALLAFLRYPLVCLPLGLLQVGNRVLYCIRTGRYRGILRGLVAIPGFCLKFRKQRQPVTLRTLTSLRNLRRA